MSGPVGRAVVEAFYDALSNCDMATLATFLDDDVVWTISGPVDILPFCGRRVGKDVVMDLLVREGPHLSVRTALRCEDNAGGRRSRRGARKTDRDQAQWRSRHQLSHRAFHSIS